MKRMENKIQGVFENCPDVRIEAGEALTPYFRPVFQSGFFFRCQVGQTIADFLFRQLLLDKDFVEERISTVFLDGECVDDISLATMQDCSVVAFSSALPGLVGATLRRDGFYACLRESITYHKEDMSVEARQGTITIKLFNLLMDELGPAFLKKGIILDRSTAISFFQARTEGFWKAIKTLYLRDLPINPKKLTEENTYDNCDHLMICVDNKSRFNEKVRHPSDRVMP
jgi:hypothetical protein